MRFIKRLVFVIVLLLLAFFIYRLINPKAAQSLLFDLKTFSNTTIGTHFSLSGDVFVTSGVVFDLTGTIESGTLQDTGALQELTGTDELLLSDSGTSSSPLATGLVTTGTTAPVLPAQVTTSTVVSVPTPVPSIKPKTTSSSNGLSSQDTRDTKNILQGFGK